MISIMLMMTLVMKITIWQLSNNPQERNIKAWPKLTSLLRRRQPRRKRTHLILLRLTMLESQPPRIKIDPQKQQGRSLQRRKESKIRKTRRSQLSRSKHSKLCNSLLSMAKRPLMILRKSNKNKMSLPKPLERSLRASIKTLVKLPNSIKRLKMIWRMPEIR